MEQVRRVLVSKEIEAETAEEAVRNFDDFKPALVDHVTWFSDRGRRDRPARIVEIVELGEPDGQHRDED